MKFMTSQAKQNKHVHNFSPKVKQLVCIYQPHERGIRQGRNTLQLSLFENNGKGGIKWKEFLTSFPWKTKIASALARHTLLARVTILSSGSPQTETLFVWQMLMKDIKCVWTNDVIQRQRLLFSCLCCMITKVSLRHF